jgi:COMPASS component SPP1
MCRLPNCRRPAAISDNPPSKYCSPQHGVEFMNRYAASRSTLSRGEIAALTNSVSTAAEFKHLGDRIPTPPPSSTRSYPEETKRLAEIASERAALEGRKRRIEQRGKYLAMAQRRKDRVLAELKNDPDMGKVSAICGYDERLALDDLEWDEWCTSQEGSEIFETGEIPGREAVCLKKACRGHKGWSALFTEEQVVLERLRCERLVLLRQEERKIRERQKRRAVKNERDGTVERES